MEKKGLSHIDWIISFGIFIILLLVIFILFGPALTQDYDDKYLGDIAQKGFKDVAFTDVARYPIFIQTSSPFGVLANYKVKLPTELQGVSVEKISITNESNSFLIYNRTILPGDILSFDYARMDPTKVNMY